MKPRHIIRQEIQTEVEQSAANATDECILEENERYARLQRSTRANEEIRKQNRLRHNEKATRLGRMAIHPDLAA